MRIAAIDIGTNSIHLLIASSRASDGFDLIDREREVVQVGRGSFRSGRLERDAIERTLEALRRFVQLARRHEVDAILCVTTAAVREAKNGGEFLRAARRETGIEPRVIPAAEEGRLIYLGVKSALELGNDPFLVLDIGGGSMQVVVGDHDRCRSVTSAPLGALRLTEIGIDHDPPTPRELERLRRRIRRAAREALAPVKALAPLPVYGSSGSIHALAQAASWLEDRRPIEIINGHVLTLKSLRRTTRALAEMTTAERERIRGIDAQRARIIVPGALVLMHVLEEVEATGITLSDFGVREGLVIDHVSREAEDPVLADVQDLRQRSALQCLTRFRADPVHARHLALLSTRLFDSLRREHGLGDDAREVLRYAALLHDVGAAIGYDGHAEHTYYIIKNAKLRGFSAEELELIANVARYHGKAKPRRRDGSFDGLRRPERRMVRWLAALLRVAEGLDRSHYQLVRELRVRRRNGIVIQVAARPEAQLEIWAARQRVDLLARMAKVPVRIDVVSSRSFKHSRATDRREADAAAPPKRDPAGATPATARRTNGSAAGSPRAAIPRPRG